MIAMILAAGEGQRFRPYTNKTPKPALPFCGYPLLYYSLFQLRNLGVDKLVLNTYHLPEKILELTQGLPSCFVQNIEISNERLFGKLLGSGGGIALAQNALQGSGPFLVLNGDEVILPFKTFFMKDFMACYASQLPLACLLTTSHPEAGKKFGAVWVDEQNQVAGFGKTIPDSRKNLRPMHFLGTQMFDERIFSYLKPGEESNILYDTLTSAIGKGERVFSYEIDCHWYETGNLADYLNATHHTLKLIEDKFEYLTDFYNLLGAEYSLFKTHSALILAHKSAQVSSEAAINGFLVAGANCVVANDTKLTNAVLGPGFKVGPSSGVQSEFLGL
jgi:mannose-1-phosphate guanylyltransferase